jgi:predicted lipase
MSHPALLDCVPERSYCIQIAQVAHPPHASHHGRQCRVHRGFLATWTANGIDTRVLDFVRNLLASGEVRPKVLVCGHSLGGAVASLAALDIARACPEVLLGCYTFGCPRVGNHAFAAEYAAAVPNTWHLICERDAVANSMKLWGWCGSMLELHYLAALSKTLLR